MLRRLNLILSTLWIPVALVLSPSMASSQHFNPLSESGLQEGFDRESPDEIERANREIQRSFRNAILPESLSDEEKNRILEKYVHLDPKREIPTDLLETTVLYFDKNKDKFRNQNHLTVIDFRPRSDAYRFYLVNIKTGAVEKYHTTHGQGSDQDRDGYAERFLNVVNSGASSVGFVRTGETYSGKFKRSLRLDGLSTTNSRIRQRAVVVHGWDYAYEANVVQGLSWGCPALDWKVKDRIIDRIHGGSLMYIGLSQE